MDYFKVKWVSAMATNLRRVDASLAAVFATVFLLLVFQPVANAQRPDIGMEADDEPGETLKYTATTEQPSLITCYECDDLDDDNMCDDFMNRSSSVVECKYPRDVCMQGVTTSFDVVGGRMEVAGIFARRMCANSTGGTPGCSIQEGTSSTYESCLCHWNLCNEGHVMMTSYVTLLMALVIASFCLLSLGN